MSEPIVFICETCKRHVQATPRGNGFSIGRCQDHPRARVIPEGAVLVASGQGGLAKKSFSVDDVGEGNRARLSEVSEIYRRVRRRLDETEGTKLHRGFHAACMCLYFRCLALRGEEWRDRSDFTPEHDAASEREIFIREMKRWQRSDDDKLATSLSVVVPELEAMLMMVEIAK